jgi:hypothetical protein
MKKFASGFSAKWKNFGRWPADRSVSGRIAAFVLIVPSVAVGKGIPPMPFIPGYEVNRRPCMYPMNSWKPWRLPLKTGKNSRNYSWKQAVATSAPLKPNERIDEVDLLQALNQLLTVRFGGISRPIRKNLAFLTLAFLKVLATIRSGNGGLSLAALARALPTPGTAHAREKRLHRFLHNPRLDFRTVASSLAATLLAPGRRCYPVLIDQTKSGSAQALLAAVPYAGRALPLACYTFAYPLTEPGFDSQNQLEHLFLLEVENAFPPGATAVWIADRGFARSLLLAQSEKEGRPYIIRGRKGPIITYQGKRSKLHQLSSTPGIPRRYENVRFHAQRQVLVDVIVYQEAGFQEPWFLLVPAAFRALLPTDLVVALYRERMQIEQSFRDFKTHLGLRGLQLQVDIAPRMGRLLLAFLLAYIFCLLLGESPLGQTARLAFEIPRRTPRHGTTRTLSALTLAMLLLAHPAWKMEALIALLNLIAKAIRGSPLLPPAALSFPKSIQ